MNGVTVSLVDDHLYLLLRCLLLLRLVVEVWGALELLLLQIMHKLSCRITRISLEKYRAVPARAEIVM